MNALNDMRIHGKYDFHHLIKCLLIPISLIIQEHLHIQIVVNYFRHHPIQILIYLKVLMEGHCIHLLPLKHPS